MKTGEFDTLLVAENLEARCWLLPHIQATIAPPVSLIDDFRRLPKPSMMTSAERRRVDVVPALMHGTVMTVSGCARRRPWPQGDSLMVLEAMKMEHVVRAPTGGTVLAVAAKAGEMVAEGAKLFRIRIGEGDCRGATEEPGQHPPIPAGRRGIEEGRAAARACTPDHGQPG